MLAAAAACGDDSSTSTGTLPTQQPTILQETFTGTLLRNAAYTHPFSVTDSGDVLVYLIVSSDARDPNNTAIPIGVSLGTWNVTTSSCATVVANDQMAPGTPIPLTGRATAAGNLCVRVYDVGFVPAASTYELLVDHY
jgi:hypothetical protein